MITEKQMSDALLMAERTMESMYSDLIMKDKLIEIQKSFIKWQGNRIDQLELQVTHLKEMLGE